MNKEFSPYFNLWTTVDLWRKSHKSWLHDEFALLDAQKLEETVDNSNKTMA
jgi:dynein heavy chain